MISFIIPCAGKGSRLGIPFPKELFPIDKDITLIDKVFDYIRPFKDNSNIIIIISEDKSDLIKYIKKYNEDFKITFIFQNNNLKELTGAIKSAQQYFSDDNILLLPDIILIDDKLNLKLEELINKNQCVSYLVKEEYDLNILKKMGAMKIENNILISTIDKPTIDEAYDNEFNCYWVSIAFKKECANDFLNNFELMQKHKKYNKKYFKKMPVIKINYALDLGVWENIRKYYYDLETTLHRNS